MKHIDNYILEKLHIGKGYKHGKKIENWEEFLEYLVSLGIDYIKDTDYWSIIGLKDTDYSPNMFIYHGVHCFSINSFTDAKKGIIQLYPKKNADDDEAIRFSLDDYNFDINEEQNSILYEYTAHNAELLIELLETAKEKFCN